MLILLGAFLVATAILGYASGVTGHRPSLVADLLVALIVVVFIIIDLDRPRRGLTRVNQGSLHRPASCDDRGRQVRRPRRGGRRPPAAPVAPVGAGNCRDRIR